jgi:hypothetical protein
MLFGGDKRSENDKSPNVARCMRHVIYPLEAEPKPYPTGAARAKPFKDFRQRRLMNAGRKIASVVKVWQWHGSPLR